MVELGAQNWSAVRPRAAASCPPVEADKKGEKFLNKVAAAAATHSSQLYSTVYYFMAYEFRILYL